MPRKVVEKNYCHCVQKVKRKNPDINPYAICTDSVYASRGLTRDKVVNCDKYYNLDKMNVQELREQAKRKNIKLTKNGKYKRKNVLLKEIKNRK